MNDFTTIAVAIFGSGALTALINGIIELIKNRTGRKGKNDKAIQFCLLFSLQSFGNELANQEYVTREEYNQFLEMYTVYKAMGGNGYAERLKSVVDTVPIMDGRRNVNNVADEH